MTLELVIDVELLKLFNTAENSESSFKERFLVL